MTDREAAEPHSLFAPGENCLEVATADRVGWLVDGEAYFGAIRRSVEDAEHEILIVGWDIDSRVHLVRDENDPAYPSPLAQTLQALVEARPDLSVYVLSWDFAMIYVLERELLPAYRFGWHDSDRLHFHLDDRHATGASHHQKFVVVDGALAYSGGFDLTRNRWDTREHAPDDPRRVDRDGEVYRPFHDVQAIVSGDAARAIRRLGARRWQDATGNALPELDQDRQPWPEGVPVRGENVPTALARTFAEPDGSETVQEVERLFIDMIAASKRSIYIENQYYTSASITDALCRRLADADGPEILLVLPGETSGWLEQATMDVLRNRAIDRLRAADEHGRLQIVSPVSDELSGPGINVHSKIMVVDDAYARIGSANLSRRSMGLDSELDVVFADDGVAAALSADLLAEHLGADPAEVGRCSAERGLLAVLAQFDGGRRRLEPLETGRSQLEDVLEPVARIADLEQPVERAWDTMLNRSDADDGAAEEPEPPGGGGLPFRIPAGPVLGWAFLGAMLLAAAGFAIRHAGQDGIELDLGALLEQLRTIADHPWAAAAVVPAFVLGSLVVAPVTGMIALAALLFDPWTASATAIGGTLAATVVNHVLGGYLGRAVAGRAPRRVFDKLRKLGGAADAWSLAGLRLIPVAPFTIVNLLAGAAHVPLRAFLAGTLIGMGPGIVVICFSVDRARAALAGEPVFEPWVLAVIVAAGALLIGLRVLAKRREA